MERHPITPLFFVILSVKINQVVKFEYPYMRFLY